MSTMSNVELFDKQEQPLELLRKVDHKPETLLIIY